MSDGSRDLRTTLVDLVLAAGIFGLRDDNLEQDYVDGGIDPALDDIGIDSLAEMELCIAIEKAWGASLTPAELRSQETLNGILSRVELLRAKL